MEGSLTGFSLQEIFELLAMKNKTGVVTIESTDTGSGRVWLKEGKFCGAQTPTLEAFEEDVDIDRARTSEKIMDAILEITQWETSVYSFRPEEANKIKSADLFDVDEVLKGVAQRQEEWRRITAEIPSMRAKVELISDTKAEAINLSRKEWALVTMIGKNTTVQDLGEALNLGPFQVCRTLFEMSKTGLIRCLGEVTGTSSASAPAQSRRKIAALDKKYIRKSLSVDDQGGRAVPAEWASYYQLLDSRHTDLRSSARGGVV